MSISEMEELEKEFCLEANLKTLGDTWLSSLRGELVFNQPQIEVDPFRKVHKDELPF